LLIVSRDLLEPAVADLDFTAAVAVRFDLPEAVVLAGAAVCPPVLPLPVDELPAARAAAFRPATLRNSFDSFDVDDALALDVDDFLDADLEPRRLAPAPLPLF